jgi:hypothetical protein
MSVFTNDTSYRVAADTMTGLSRAAIVKLINTGIGSSALTDGNGTTANGTSIDLGDVNIDNGWHWTYNYGGGSYLDWYFNTTSPRFYMSSYKVSNGALAEYTHIADGIYLNQQEGDIMIQAELNNNYFGASIDSVGRNTDLRVNLDRIDINSNHPNFTGLKYLVEPTYENGTLISKSYADANYGNVANGIFEVSSGENSYYDQDTSLFTLGGEPSFYIPSLYYKAWKKDLSKFSQYTFNANGFDFDLYGYGLDNNLRVQADTNDFLIFTSYPVSTNLFQVTHDSVILHQLSGNTGKLLALSSTGGVYSYHLAHAAAYREAITYTPAVTQNVYTKITPTFTISEADSITIAGDTITIKTGYDGDYKLDFSLTMSGANGDDFRVKLYKNNATTGVNGSNHVTTTGATNYVSLSYFWYLTDLVAGDDLSFRITNTTDSDDPTITDIKFYIEKKPE